MSRLRACSLRHPALPLTLHPRTEFLPVHYYNKTALCLVEMRKMWEVSSLAAKLLDSSPSLGSEPFITPVTDADTHFGMPPPSCPRMLWDFKSRAAKFLPLPGPSDEGFTTASPCPDRQTLDHPHLPSSATVSTPCWSPGAPLN